MLNIACWSIRLLPECSAVRFSRISSIWDPFCGWFWVVFWYILGSDTLQFPHNFDKSQGRACSNFNVLPLADSVILTYFKQNPGSEVLEVPLVVLNVACWSVGLLGSIFHYFLDLGSILWMFWVCVWVHLRWLYLVRFRFDPFRFRFGRGHLHL